MLTDRRRGLSAFAADDRGVPETDRGDAMPELGCDGRGDEGGRNLDGLGDAARGKLDVAEGVFNLEDGPSPVGVLVANRDGCGSADGVAMVLVCWSSRTWGLGGDCSVETGQDKDAAQGRPGCMRKRDVFTTKVGWMQLCCPLVQVGRKDFTFVNSGSEPFGRLTHRLPRSLHVYS